MTAERLRRILVLVATRDIAAADELDALADDLRKLAAEIRVEHTNPTKSTGGASDRVQMQLVGPDGHIKHTTDTGTIP